jgi:hypothetical protein
MKKQIAAVASIFTIIVASSFAVYADACNDHPECPVGPQCQCQVSK